MLYYLYYFQLGRDGVTFLCVSKYNEKLKLLISFLENNCKYKILIYDILLKYLSNEFFKWLQ